MNERYDNHDAYPQLALWEIETLAERAIGGGEIKEVDYPDEQILDQPQPYSFVLPIDAEPFEELVKEWQDEGFETVTSAEIEYDPARVLDIGEPQTLPMVYVSVSSAIYDPANPTLLITKDTVFMLPLVSDEQATVKEAYTLKGHARYEFIQGNKRRMIEMMSDEIRPLAESDVNLLRILLSSE